MGAVAGGKGEEVCLGVRLKTKRPNKDSNKIFKIPKEVVDAIAVKTAATVRKCEARFPPRLDLRETVLTRGPF